MTQLLEQLGDAVRRLRDTGGDADPQAVEALESVLNRFPVAALIADDNGAYRAANREAADLTGYTLPELRRLSVWQLTPGVEENEATQLWRAFIAVGDQRGAYHLVTKSGHTVDALYAARANVLPGLHLALLRRVA